MNKFEIKLLKKEVMILISESFKSRQLSFLDNFGIQVTEATGLFEVVAVSMIVFYNKKAE